MTASARSAARKLSRREELGVESRRKIVEAAAALMAERGFAGTSIAAVSQRSGLPSGSIYWHFENKEALLSAVVEEGAQRWFDSVWAGEPLPTDAAARAQALFEKAAASLESQPEFLRLLILIALERREVDKASVAVIRRVRALALQYIRDLLVDLLDGVDRRKAKRLSDEFSRLVLCVADGAFLANHIDPAGTDVRNTFALLRRALTALARELLGAPSQRKKEKR
jgi:AcrR family transcriptional regulator